MYGFCKFCSQNHCVLLPTELLFLLCFFIVHFLQHYRLIHSFQHYCWPASLPPWPSGPFLAVFFLLHIFTSVWSHLNIASLMFSHFHVKKLTFLVSYSEHLLFGCFLTPGVIFGSSIYFREINCSRGPQQLDVVLKNLGGFFCVYICSRWMEVQEVWF